MFSIKLNINLNLKFPEGNMEAGAPNLISHSFKTATKEDWLNAARFELEGADPMQKLASEKGNLTLLPYYDQLDQDLEQFQLNPSANVFLGARAWHNMPSLDVVTESQSNKEALLELNSGADGIIFNLKTDKTDISALLEKIEWPYCAISFTGNVSETFFKEIHAHAQEKKYDVTTLTGCVFNSHKLKNAFSSLKLFSDWKNFHPLGVEVEKKESPDEGIAKALAQAVKQIDFLTDQSIPIKLAAQFLAFKVQIDEDFFLNIAKLKSLRHLWQNVVAAYDSEINTPLFVHATSPAWNKKEYQPNANILKSTTAALSAILGGCDALTVFAEESNSNMMTRIARNVSSVLREESHLSKVADPTAGSYFIESLTNQLSEKAWKKFLELIK